MSKSKLTDYVRISPNQSGARKHKVDRITPHSIVGQMSVESLGNWFSKKTTQASSNYGIGFDGKIGLYVAENCRSWCSSSSENDNRAITIECACEAKHPYTFNQCVYDALVDLCVDICTRYGKTKLLWLRSKDKTLNYKPKSNEMILTVHKWFANTTCPNKWMLDHMDDLADDVTKRLKKATTKWFVQFGAFHNKDNADRLVKSLAKKGENTSVKKDGDLYHVVKGGFTKAKAEKEKNRLIEKGYSVILIRV